LGRATGQEIVVSFTVNAGKLRGVTKNLGEVMTHVRPWTEREENPEPFSQTTTGEVEEGEYTMDEGVDERRRDRGVLVKRSVAESPGAWL